MLISVHSLPELLRLVTTQADRGVLALASFPAGAQSKEILSRLCDAGYSEAEDWPIGSRFSKDRRVKAKRGAGTYVLTSAGRDWVRAMAPDLGNGAAKTRADLRKHADRIADPVVREFVLEAIGAFEHGYFRSAVVMSWLAAVFVLQREVFESHREDFDALMRSKDSDWRNLKSTDDFGRINEAQFLDRANDISVIGKNVKAELKQCLDRRNACGHPNSYKLTENMVAHHVDTLIVNVFEKAHPLAPFPQSMPSPAGIP